MMKYANPDMRTQKSTGMMNIYQYATTKVRLGPVQSLLFACWRPGKSANVDKYGLIFERVVATWRVLKSHAYERMARAVRFKYFDPRQTLMD